jgi:hypothetical protein
MLSDKDRLCFGEASAVFHTSTRVPGPVPLAHDPLEGSDGLPQDGTPTGGLKGAYPRVASVRGNQEATAEEEVPLGAPEGNAGLRAQIQALQHEIAELRSADLARENERLRKLVAQLERALADSNIRIRNLQQRLAE